MAWVLARRAHIHRTSSNISYIFFWYDRPPKKDTDSARSRLTFLYNPALLKRNKYICILQQLRQVHVHYDTTITRYGYRIVYGSGCNHSQSDVGRNISGDTVDAI